MQTMVLIISLIGMLLVSAAFLFVVKNSATREDDYSVIAKKGYGIRRWWMAALFLLGVVVSKVTLTPFPLYAIAGSNPKVINAEAGQWYWELDDNTAVVGEPVQFHVSSADVNHGFALYDPQYKIIGQTQAMPGYINKLNVTFTEAGTYKVLCLEYCGLAHHSMAADIIVTEGN